MPTTTTIVAAPSNVLTINVGYTTRNFSFQDFADTRIEKIVAPNTRLVFDRCKNIPADITARHITVKGGGITRFTPATKIQTGIVVLNSPDFVEAIALKVEGFRVEKCHNFIGFSDYCEVDILEVKHCKNFGKLPKARSIHLKGCMNLISPMVVRQKGSGASGIWLHNCRFSTPEIILETFEGGRVHVENVTAKKITIKNGGNVEVYGTRATKEVCADAVAFTCNLRKLEKLTLTKCRSIYLDNLVKLNRLITDGNFSDFRSYSSPHITAPRPNFPLPIPKKIPERYDVSLHVLGEQKEIKTLNLYSRGSDSNAFILYPSEDEPVLFVGSHPYTKKGLKNMDPIPNHIGYKNKLRRKVVLAMERNPAMQQTT